MTLPTGATIYYTYANFQDATYLGGTHITRMISTMTTPDGEWTFTPAVTIQCNSSNLYDCEEKITVTKPAYNSRYDHAVYTSVVNGGVWLKEADYYTGSVSSTNLVATHTRSYDLSHPCNYGSPYHLCAYATAIEVTPIAETTTLPTPSGTNINKTTQYCYDPNYGNLLYKWEWNFYTGSIVHDPSGCSLYSGSTPDRTTTITYLSGSNYISSTRNITNRPASITVTNSSGATVAKTLNSYDGGFLASGMTGVAQHDDTNFGSSLAYRGNLTQVQRLVSGSNYLTKSMTYDITGQMRTETDWTNSNGASYSYADNFFNDAGDSTAPTAYTPSTPTNAYLKTITRGSLVTTFGYYWGTGQMAELSDLNSQTTYSHFYNSMNLPTSTQFPNTGWILTPPDVTGSLETGSEMYTGITSTQSTGCSSCRHDKMVTDSLGRPSTGKLVNDPDDPTDGTTVAITYDSNGRVYTISNPYRTSSDPTYGLTTFAYDGMDRKIQVTTADGSSKTYTYYGALITSSIGQTTQQCSTSTYGRGYPILMVDEVGNRRQTWTDGFGRIIETDEPNASGTLSPKSCYTYDLNNNLTGVLAADGSQTRSYAYDMLSRLTSKTDPETKQNTTYFFYTTSGGSLCSGDPKAICRRTNANGVTTTYTYDTLNRLTGKTYSDSTPSVTYSYDSTSCLSLSSCYNAGRRTGMSDGSGSASWAYDQVGNVLRESRTINGVNKTISYTYNKDSSLLTVQYPGGRTVTYTTGNAERPTAAVDSGNSINYATLGAYAPQGDLGSVQNGANLVSKYFYNNRLQPCRISVKSSGTSPTSCADSSNTGNVLDLAYSYAQGVSNYNNGNITTQTNNITSGRTQTYTYDPLNRLLSAQPSATSGADCWGQSFGNNATPPTLADDVLNNQLVASSTKCSSPAPSWAVNGYNQITTPSGYTYDNAGESTYDNLNTYTYDAENRLISANNGSAIYCYRYDGNDLRVQKAHAASSCTSPTVDKLYWRTTEGITVAETDSAGSTSNSNYNEYVFFAGQRVAQSNPSSGNVYYYFADHLGSTRVVTSATGSPCYEADFLPYGQENTPASFTNTCSTNYKFTGYERDTETSNDYAFARYYSYHLERFLSPDPMDGDISDPQTLNKYTYVRNNPVNLTDPTGLCGAGDESTACPAYPCDGMNCGGEGGPVFSNDDAPWPPPTPAMGQFGCETNGIPCGMQFPVGPGMSGCTYGGGNCGGMIYGWTNVNGQPVGDFNGDQYCTLFSTSGSCLSAVFWFGNSQNGGWSPVDHSTPSQRSKSPAIRKCEDAAAVAAYNKNVSTDINAAKKPIEGALSGAATGCIWGTKWGLGEGCTAGAVGGAAKGAVAGLLTGAWSMIHDAVGPAACKQ